MAAVGSLARSAEEREPMALVLARLSDAARQAIDVDGVAVGVVRDGRARLVTSRGVPAVDVLERLQADTGAGPTAESIAGFDVVVEDTRATAARWPEFSSVAGELGLGSMAALPLARNDRTWAVLSLYRERSGPWAAEELSAARLLADLALSSIVTAAAWEELLEARDRLAHHAWHDDLTGLPRRSLLLDRLGHALATGERSGSTVAVLFVDLDGFKQVNDRFGHAAGDAVLVELARRMSEGLRAGDSVSRLAGDEFVVVCEQLGERGSTAVHREVTEVVDRLRAILAAPIHVDGHALEVSASIGVALSQAGSSPERMINAADRAMYADKHARRIRGDGRGKPTGSPRRSATVVDLTLATDGTPDEGTPDEVDASGALDPSREVDPSLALDHSRALDPTPAHDAR